MDRKDLLFYDAYEAFYAMAGRSEAFQAFCAEAFGADFSQDGFSDVAQVDRILPHIPRAGDVHVLDVGCGNGKMLGYLQRRTGAAIHGFDYSAEAIRAARRLHPAGDFREGVIGQIDYPPSSFDVVTSMDTMYFAPDMTAFVGQIRRWLKPGGVLFVGYQEGDVIPKTAGAEASLLAEAARRNGLRCAVEDVTPETYALLRRKREAALRHREVFAAEGHSEWFDMLMGQTACATGSLEAFRRDMARYIFVIRRAEEKGEGGLA